MKLNEFDDLNSSFSAGGDNFYGSYGAGGDYSQYYYPGAGGVYYNYKGCGAGGDNFLVVMVLVVITTSTIVTSDDFILTVHYKLREFITVKEEDFSFLSLISACMPGNQLAQSAWKFQANL